MAKPSIGQLTALLLHITALVLLLFVLLSPVPCTFSSTAFLQLLPAQLDVRLSGAAGSSPGASATPSTAGAPFALYTLSISAPATAALTPASSASSLASASGSSSAAPSVLTNAFNFAQAPSSTMAQPQTTGMQRRRVRTLGTARPAIEVAAVPEHLPPFFHIQHRRENMSSRLSSIEAGTTPTGSAAQAASSSVFASDGSASASFSTTTAASVATETAPASAGGALNASNPQTWQTPLRQYYGLLGSCFWSARPGADPSCTRASLTPSFDNTGIQSIAFDLSTNATSANVTASGNATSTQAQGMYAGPLITGNLPTGFQELPLLLLVDFLILLVLLIGTLLPIVQPLLAPHLALDGFADAGSHERAFLAAQRYSNLLLVPAAVLLLGITIVLRIQVDNAVTGFNAANADKVLPASAMLDALSNPLPADVSPSAPSTTMLLASAGPAFSLCLIAFVLLVVLLFLRRRQLAGAVAATKARNEIEAKMGRRAFAHAAATFNTNESTASARRKDTDFEMLPTTATAMSTGTQNDAPLSPRSWRSSPRPFFPSRQGLNTHPSSEELRFADYDRSGKLSHKASFSSFASSAAAGHAFVQSHDDRRSPSPGVQRPGFYRKPSATETVASRRNPNATIYLSDPPHIHPAGRWVLRD